MPRLTRSYGVALVMSAPSSVMRPALHRHHAHQALEQRRLADTVAAEHHGDFAQAGLEGHAAQDVAAAVVLVETLDLQNGMGGVSGQDRPRRPFRWPGPRSAAPRPARCLRAAPSPSCALAVSWSTNFMSCSTTTSECLPSSDRNSSAVRSVSSSVMPATGSSSSSSLGSCISSMPISSHCFWPWLSRPAVRCASPFRWISTSTSPMRSSSAPPRRWNSAARTRRSALQRELEVLEHA